MCHQRLFEIGTPAVGKEVTGVVGVTEFDERAHDSLAAGIYDTSAKKQLFTFVVPSRHKRLSDGAGE